MQYSFSLCFHDEQSEGTRGEGDARRYYDHAIALRDALRSIRYNERTVVEGSDGGLGTSPLSVQCSRRRISVSSLSHPLRSPALR